MTLDLARDIFDDIVKTKLHSLKDELINYAIDYSRIRVDWYLSSEEERREIESIRTAKHNAFIDSCNILSREMIKAGEDASWRIKLGENRKEIGDFACYINFILGIKAK